MAVIASERLAGVSLGPFLMVVLAAMFWGSGNVLAKSLGKVDTLALVVWSSLTAPLPLSLLSFAVEGQAGLAALAETGRQCLGDLLREHGVWLWRLGASTGALFGGDCRAICAAGAGRRHGRGRYSVWRNSEAH
jgi:hypothetical protein